MEWISVKDRLPRESGLYIVYCEDEYMSAVHYSKKNKLFNSYDGDKGENAFTDVIFWAAFPAPPEVTP